MQLDDSGKRANVQVIVDIEPMRQLSTAYELGDRQQVYAARGIGSQIGRSIIHQRYSDAQPYIGIWLCFNREANTFQYGTYKTESVSYSRNKQGEPVRDTALETKRSLAHIYTIGFTNDGPTEEHQERRALFQLLTALYSATMSKNRKAQILHDEFGLCNAPERTKIEEDIQHMGTLTAVIERELSKRFEIKEEEYKEELRHKDSELQDKDAELQNKDAELQDKDAELQDKDAELRHKDAQLQDRDSELERARKEIAELRKRLGLRPADPVTSGTG